MKITIEQEGQEPKVLDGIIGYQVLVTTKETTRTYGKAADGIDLWLTLTMAQAIENLYNKFLPFIRLNKALSESENMSE